MEDQEKKRERAKRYRENHPDRIKAQREKYREQDIMFFKEKEAYYKEHPEELKEKRKRYRDKHEVVSNQ